MTDIGLLRKAPCISQSVSSSPRILKNSVFDDTPSFLKAEDFCVLIDLMLGLNLPRFH
jgi:hypothetical protein